MKLVCKRSYYFLCILGFGLYLVGWHAIAILSFVFAGFCLGLSYYWALMEETLRFLVGGSPFDVPRPDRIEWFIKTQPKADKVMDCCVPYVNYSFPIRHRIFAEKVFRRFGFAIKRSEIRPNLEVVGGRNVKKQTGN